jgi:DNA-binding NtrC family response regulator
VLRWGVFCDDVVDVADLSPEIRAWAGGPDGHGHGQGPSSSARPGAKRARDPAPVVALEDAVQAAERAAIAAALEASSGNLSRTARALRIDRNTLKRKLASYGLRPS